MLEPDCSTGIPDTDDPKLRMYNDSASLDRSPLALAPFFSVPFIIFQLNQEALQKQKVPNLVSDNVLRISEVCILLSYSLRFWEYAVM